MTNTPPARKNPVRVPNPEEIDLVEDSLTDIHRVLTTLMTHAEEGSVWGADDALFGLSVHLETALHRVRAVRAKTHLRGNNE